MISKGKKGKIMVAVFAFVFIFAFFAAPEKSFARSKNNRGGYGYGSNYQNRSYQDYGYNYYGNGKHSSYYGDGGYGRTYWIEYDRFGNRYSRTPGW